MRALRDLVCWLFGHCCPPGVSKARSIAYMCDRCNRVVVGDLGLRRRT